MYSACILAVGVQVGPAFLRSTLVVQFINEPVKATSEPDGSRYIEVHNPLSTSEDQINNNEIVPVTLNSAVQSVTSQPDVETAIVDQAVQNRSGMPVRLN